MGDNQANNQIRQMVNFILQEAHEKANEIRIKALAALAPSSLASQPRASREAARTSLLPSPSPGSARRRSTTSTWRSRCWCTRPSSRSRREYSQKERDREVRRARAALSPSLARG